MRKAPSRPAVGPGEDAAASATLRVMGQMMLPPGGVSGGSNGARATAAATSEYPSDSVLLAKRWIKRKAMRWPRRVTVTARANRNAEKTNHTVRLEKPLSTREDGTIPKTARRVIAVSALTP